jgi:NADPH:quinone reductase-like Zn-dependent oxidoreductase
MRARLELVKSLGADKLIEYNQEVFSDIKEKYDVIFDTVGKSPFFESIYALKPNGFYVLANPGLFNMLRGLWITWTTDKRVVFGSSEGLLKHLEYLRDLIEEDKLIPVVDRRYSLDQMVEAHRYVDKGHKKGNVSNRLLDDESVFPTHSVAYKFF